MLILTFIKTVLHGVNKTACSHSGKLLSFHDLRSDAGLRI